MVTRRQLLQAAMGTLLTGPVALRAQQGRIPIADMHSHYGMITRRGAADSGFAEDLRANGVALVAWKLVADARWIRSGRSGIEQFAEPKPGELSAFFNTSIERMKAYVESKKLRMVLGRADVDACVAGESGIVLASEGADFLEGRVENLDAAYEKGLRHLQFVHYIRTPVGDFQTEPPVHNGLSTMGRQLIEACNAKGILVDLAHSTGQAIDQALEIAKAPVVWSHSWVQGGGGSHRDASGFLMRRLSLAHAKKIAERGGVIGLWGFGTPRSGLGWSAGQGDTKGYAYEVASLVEKIGADAVAFGTDIEGLGTFWSINDYGHLRSVIDHLQEMKLPASTIEKVACANYARVLKAALKA